VTSKKSIIFISFFLLLAYAAVVTFHVGPKRIASGVYKRTILPISEQIFGRAAVLETYVEEACPTEDVIGIAYFGQSNATNTVRPMANIDIPSNLLQYDWKSDACYAYKEPLLGADFKHGSNLTYAAVKIANTSKKTVVVIPFGYGPSTVLEWAYGQGASQHSIVLKQLKESGLYPQVFLWHQGESDTAIDGVSDKILREIPYFQRPDLPFKNGSYRVGIHKDSYKNALNVIVQRTRKEFPESYFGIALVSHAPCLKCDGLWQPIREAQKEVAMSDAMNFISADSDKIKGPANRYDTCHFSAEGAERLSEEYFQSLSSLNIF
jgi:hypothetical protein